MELERDAMAFDQAAARLANMLDQGDLEFVAAVMTHWHAMGADAWVRRLRQNGQTGRGAVVLLPHVKTGLGLCAADLPYCQADGNVEVLPVGQLLTGGTAKRLGTMFVTAMRLLWMRLIAPGPQGRPGKPPLHVASAMDAGAAVYCLARMGRTGILRRRDVRIAVLDEGLAAYFSREFWEYIRKLDTSDQGRFTRVRWLDDRLYGAWHSLQRGVAARLPLEQRPVFLPGPSGVLQPNEPVLEDYRQSMTAGPQPPEVGSGECPRAVLLTQPWAQDGQIDPDVEKRLLREVLKRLSERGYEVLVKPHPREPRGKYESLLAEQGAPGGLLPQAITVERLFPALNSKDVVVGYNSTSLLTAALLYKLRAYTIGDTQLCRAHTGGWYGRTQEGFAALSGDAVVDFEKEFGTL